MPASLTNGKICYIEIPATDIQRSVEFYKKIFGWRIRKRGDGNTAFDDAIGAVSGTWILGRPAATEPGLLIYIMVDSIAKTVDAIIANGCEIAQPLERMRPKLPRGFAILPATSSAYTKNLPIRTPAKFSRPCLNGIQGIGFWTEVFPVMTISEMLLPEFDEEMKNTRKLLERVPEDKLAYKPHEKSMALGRLASHVAELPGWSSRVMGSDVFEVQQGQKPFSAQSRQELLEKFDESVAEGRKAIASASDEHLAKIWSLQFGGKPVFTLPKSAVVRNMMMNHLIHHRAQLGVYLRLNEVEIPGMYGPSADEMKFWEPPKKA